jgi:hypothetical protein
MAQIIICLFIGAYSATTSKPETFDRAEMVNVENILEYQPFDLHAKQAKLKLRKKILKTWN